MIETAGAEIAALARGVGAELIVGVDPISLGVLAPPADYGADIVVGSLQPLGVHMNGGGGIGGFIATRDEERYARQYPTLCLSAFTDRRSRASSASASRCSSRPRTARASTARDWTGNSVYLWAIVDRRLHGAAGPAGHARGRRGDPARAAMPRRAGWRRSRASRSSTRTASSRSSSCASTAPAGPSPRSTAALLEHGIFGGKDLSADLPGLGQSALYCVTEVHTSDDIERLAAALAEVTR